MFPKSWYVGIALISLDIKIKNPDAKFYFYFLMKKEQDPNTKDVNITSICITKKNNAVLTQVIECMCYI